MIWFLKSRQAQTLKDSSVVNSTLQQTQAGRDALSFQNVEQVTIVYNGLFGSRPIAIGIDWEWAGRVIHEQQAEVRNRLKYVLRDRDPLPLQLSEQPERVNLPALESERRLTIAGEDSELLDPGQLMIEVFGRGDIAGKLLILGTPGAGKTTLLLSLAEQLLAGANTQACAEGYDNPKTVIPVIFELSTWKNDNQSIQDWLIEQLYDLYGGDRKLKRYEQWLEQRVLLPLLDGLDELGMERQQKCMAKLNEFTRQYPQVVVCCRSKEFEESEIRLGNLRGAVELEPLSDRQIQTYLQQVEREGLWQQIQETPEMRQMLEPIEGEAGLLRVPLFVSFAAAIYDGNQPFRTKGELLERYIDRQLDFDVRMSDRRKESEKRKWAYATVEKEPAVKPTRQYLAWLARQLNEINEVDFLIERIQPHWLGKPHHQRLYRLIFGVVFGSIFGLTFALIFGLTFALICGSIFALTAIFQIGISDIESVESFQPLMSHEAQQKIRQKILHMLKRPLFAVLIDGLTGVLLTRSIGILVAELKQALPLRSHPNQGIWNSLRNTALVAALSYPIFVMAVSISPIVTKLLINQLWSDSTDAVLTNTTQLSGFFGAISFGLSAGGGQAFIQHFCLRFVLAYSVTFPFFCVPFLNYCAERKLLQPIGGRYRFIHRELLEHFAQQTEVGK